MADEILDLHPDSLSLRELRNNNNANYDKVNKNFDIHKKRIDNIVASTGSSNTEIVDSRYDSIKGVTYPTLKERLDIAAAELKDKANDSEVRKKSVKLELEDMSETTLGAMSGNATFNLLSIPQDESVSNVKLAPDVKDVLGASNAVIFNKSIFDPYRIYGKPSVNSENYIEFIFDTQGLTLTNLSNINVKLNYFISDLNINLLKVYVAQNNSSAPSDLSGKLNAVTPGNPPIYNDTTEVNVITSTYETQYRYLHLFVSGTLINNTLMSEFFLSNLQFYVGSVEILNLIHVGKHRMTPESIISEEWFESHYDLRGKKTILDDIIYLSEQRIDVKKLGAKGDGVTDDTLAIQNALNIGGNVYFPKGTYLLNSVTVKSNTRISGSGKGVSILKFINNPTGPMLDCRGVGGNNKENIEIRDLTFANKVDHVGTDYVGVFIAGDYTKRVQIDNVEFKEFNTHAIYARMINDNVTEPHTWKITNCLFHTGGTASTGIYCGDEAEYMIINSCSFHTLTCGVKLSAAANNQVQNCTFLKCGSSTVAVIEIDINTNNNGGKILIQGCALNHNFGDGIKVTSARNTGQHGVNVVGNEILITPAGKVPIRLIGSNGSMIANNRLWCSNANDFGVVLSDNGAVVANFNMITSNIVMIGAAVNNTSTGANNITSGNIGNVTV